MACYIIKKFDKIIVTFKFFYELFLISHLFKLVNEGLKAQLTKKKITCDYPLDYLMMCTVTKWSI